MQKEFNAEQLRQVEEWEQNPKEKKVTAFVFYLSVFNQ
jgi:hypothetical protein